MTFYNIPLVCAHRKNIINTMSLCTTSPKLDLHCVVLQSSLINSCPRVTPCLLPFDYKGSMVSNISCREVHSLLTIFILSATQKDIGLFVSIACPGSIEDRSVVVRKAMLSHP